MKVFLICFAIFSISKINLYGQGCCSGGGNNPLAGSGPTGVLAEGQLEFTFNNIFSNSNKFYTGTKLAESYFEKTISNYSLLRFEYGLNERLTLSTSIGYYGFRTIFENIANEDDEQNLISTKGIGDLTFLPRYRLFSTTRNGRTTELNIGLGVKLPLSQPNDSNYVGKAFFINQRNGEAFLDSHEIWKLSPPLVQVSTGSNDLMASFFFLHSLNKKFTFLASGLYLNRGWNYLGIKYGNYASLGLFLGRSIGRSFNASLQIRAESVGKISTMPEVDYVAKYNIDKTSTGSFALHFSPLISYHYQSFRIFTILDFPIYQNLKGTQVSLPILFNMGAAYSFFPSKKDRLSEKTIDFSLFTDTTNSMDFEDTVFTVYGVCNMCKERIEKTVMTLSGIASANYDINQQILTLSYNKNLIDLDVVKVQLAKVGHDTDTHRAKKSAYNSLHKCCKYKRPDPL